MPVFFPLKKETEGKSGNPETDTLENISQIHLERDVIAYYLQVLHCLVLYKSAESLRVKVSVQMLACLIPSSKSQSSVS